ncbi:glycosyltransferase family 4 protein [Sediminibacterium sp.]|uniref:glycosyltransferase family 4 protein n=1 Tax=Sediminibacterium sp. TaxID=1917865 RepID=UPI003F713016
MAKIVILYEILGRSRGGIEAWIYHASEELIRSGNDVTLINKQLENPIDSAPNGVKIITLKESKKNPISDIFFEIQDLRNQLKELLSDFDIIWTRSFRMAYAAAKIVGKGKVVYINAAPFSFYGQKGLLESISQARSIRELGIAISSKLYLVFAYNYERKAIDLCKNVFLSHARMNETINYFKLKYFEDKYLVVPAGVDSNRFKPLAIKVLNKEIFFSIISVCRLEYDKNIQCVIGAVSHIVNQGFNIRYTILGTGNYENELKRLVLEKKLQDYIFFAGRQESIEEWYIKNDVFVLPSLYEGFGSVYIEAMACGLPCIAISNMSGKYSVASDEIIDHDINGYLLHENDELELSKVLIEFMNNKTVLKSMSKSARLKAMTKYNWSETVKKILEFSHINN